MKQIITVATKTTGAMSYFCSAAINTSGVINCPLRFVYNGMLHMINKHKIFNSIVCHIAVDVMHHLVASKSASQMSLHHVAMFVHTHSRFWMNNPRVTRTVTRALWPVLVARFLIAGAGTVLPVSSGYMRWARVEIMSAIEAMTQNRRKFCWHTMSFPYRIHSGYCITVQLDTQELRSA